ncbi:MAG: hypothetical protein KKI08_12810, partial [Armatimonadetes bacterium]|nr:hypothetical protein [Armatimonadota bacterium]
PSVAVAPIGRLLRSAIAVPVLRKKQNRDPVLAVQAASDAAADPGRTRLAVVTDPFQFLVAGSQEFEAHGRTLVPAGELLTEFVARDPPTPLVVRLGEPTERDYEPDGTCR